MASLFLFMVASVAYSYTKHTLNKDVYVLVAFFVCLLLFNAVTALYILAIATAVYAALNFAAKSPKTNPKHSFALLLIFIFASLFGTKYALDKLGLRTEPLTTFSTLGFTYLALRLMHYASGRYHKRFQPHTLTQFLLYVFFLPIFLAGPIQPFDTFYKQRKLDLNHHDRAQALFRVCLGLIKVFALTSLLSFASGGYTPARVAEIFLNASGVMSPAKVWLALVFCTVYFYLNFAGYCDIAIGISKFLGFTIVENFNSPLLSTNLVSYWQRWHMSLGVWCREFVFFPLSRLVKSAALGALLTFIVIGLWHGFGLHWLIYGVWHGVGVIGVVGWQKKGFKLTNNHLVGSCMGWSLTMLYVSAGTLFALMAEHDDLQQTLGILALALGFA